jgi:hypothetical protein
MTIIRNIMSYNGEECMLVAGGPGIARETDFRIQFLKARSEQHLNRHRKPYLKHLPRPFDGILAHLHDVRAHGVAARNPEVEGGPMVGVLQKSDKFRFLDFVKGLVASDDPFRKKSIERGLIKVPLR